VDYDSSDDLKKKLNVTKQSTLIIFKGEKEVARSIGVTDPKAICELIQKGL
jgi:thioredoxin 1